MTSAFKAGLLSTVVAVCCVISSAEATEDRPPFVGKWFCHMSEDRQSMDTYYFMPNGRFLTSNEVVPLDLFKIIATRNDWTYDSGTQTIQTRLSLVTHPETSSDPITLNISVLNANHLRLTEAGITKDIRSDECE